MKMSLLHARVLLQISVGVFILALIVSVRMFFGSVALQESMNIRHQTRKSLAQLEAESVALHELMDMWGIGEGMSLQISQTLSAAFSELEISDPALVGSFRLHQATIMIPEGSTEDIMNRLSSLVGLPVRVSSISLSTDASGQLSGAIELRWLERR